MNTIKKGERILARHINAAIHPRRMASFPCADNIVGARHIVARDAGLAAGRIYFPISCGRIPDYSQNKPLIDLSSQYFDGDNLYIVQTTPYDPAPGFLIPVDFLERRTSSRGSTRYIHAGIGVVMIQRSQGDDDLLRRRRAFFYGNYLQRFIYFSVDGPIQVLWVGDKFSWNGRQYSYAVIRWSGI